MRFWVLHLSDIHIGAAGDKILEMASAIAESTAVHSFDVKQARPDLLIALITGDASFSGQSDQFSLVKSFIETIKRKLQSQFKYVHIAITPGNHDANLQKSGVRTALLNGFTDEAYDSEYFAEVASVQKEFWSFAGDEFPSAPSLPSLGVSVRPPA